MWTCSITKNEERRFLIMKKMISSFTLLVLLFIFLCPSQALANVVELSELDRKIEITQQYLYYSEDGRLCFDEEAATANDEDLEIILFGQDLEEFALKYYNYYKAQEMGVAPAVSIPVYGNYCGPEYGSGMPIDVLDDQCRKHDECYGGTNALEGYHSCYCDRTLVRDVRMIYSSLIKRI